MDDNPGVIEPFLKEHKLDLTVLPAYSYVEDTLKVFGIPQNWIVDANGVIRLKGVGYDATGKWETVTIQHPLNRGTSPTQHWRLFGDGSIGT